MGRLWELLILLVIGSIILRAAIDFLIPLVPYMLGAVVLLAVLGGVYYKQRRW
jgi:uncharacterized membrane protein YcaP (DUF421 family)